MAENKTKIDLDLVRLELGIPIPYRWSLRESVKMVLLGMLVSWFVLFGILGDQTARRFYEWLGLLR